MKSSAKLHWPEYLMEAAGLGIFMLSACFFTALLMHPSSPVQQAIPSLLIRRGLIGIAMGLTGICLVYSPWGRQSGAHFNPAVTLTFLRLGKIAPRDAAFYIVSQFVGGVIGVAAAARLFPALIGHSSVHYVVTSPGQSGPTIAFVAEAGMTFLLMSTILTVTNTPSLARYTALFTGSLVALYITVEAPLSGMSMNPARTFGSALSAGDYTALWVYFTAPLLGMFAAAEIYIRRRGVVTCAKLHHDNRFRCIFCAYSAERDKNRSARRQRHSPAEKAAKTLQN